MRRRASIWIALGLATSGWAADPVLFAGLPPVPNPYGFDDRLALRSHLEETLHRSDLAGRSLDELLAIYRSAQAPVTTQTAGATAAAPADTRRQELAYTLRQRYHLEAAPGETADDLAQRLATAEAEASEQLRRQNLLLQLREQFHAQVDPQASTEDLARQVADLLAEAPEPTTAKPAASAPRTAAKTVAEPPVAAAPIRAVRRTVTLTPIALTALAKPEGVTAAFQVTQDGDRIVGISFNRSLDGELTNILAYAAGAMAHAKAASTCLILLGHGDGTHIGMGETAVDLTNHLKTNREAYHALLGVSRIDCVAVLSCSRSSDRQFLAFRDGLGYYPTWRVSSWENTYQTALSGLGALSLILDRDSKDDFRAAVYHGEESRVASLGEIGNRAATQFLAATIGSDGLVMTPVRRR